MKISEINYIYIPDKDYQISLLKKERDRIINDLTPKYTFYNIIRYIYGEDISDIIKKERDKYKERYNEIIKEYYRKKI